MSDVIIIKTILALLALGLITLLVSVIRQDIRAKQEAPIKEEASPAESDPGPDLKSSSASTKSEINPSANNKAVKKKKR